MSTWHLYNLMPLSSGRVHNALPGRVNPTHRQPRYNILRSPFLRTDVPGQSDDTLKRQRKLAWTKVRCTSLEICCSVYAWVWMCVSCCFWQWYGSCSVRPLHLYFQSPPPHPVPAPYRKIEPLKGAAILFWPYKDNKNSLLDTGRNKKKVDPYFSGVGLVLGVVVKAERRIAVVVDGRKNLFFFTGCKCKNKLCNWASVCFFSTILKVESTTAGCHVALFQFFLSF